MDITPFIRAIPDFPKPGILFRDITPLLGNPGALEHVVGWMADETAARTPDVVVGVESRGFLFGAPVALRLGLPFVPVRKPGKLPAKRMSVEYSLEYGESQLDIHEDAFARGSRVVIIDDLLATGGTSLATAKLVELVGGSVALNLFLIELGPLGGRARLEPYDVQSLLVY